MARKSKIRPKDILVLTLMLSGDAALSASIYFTFIAGWSEKAATLEQQVQQKKTELNDLTKSRSEEGMLRTRHEEVSRTIPLLLERMKKASGTPEAVLEFLYAASREHRVNISRSKRIADAPFNSLFDVVTCEVEAAGSYHQIGQVLNVLEECPQFVRVRALNLTGVSGGVVRAKFYLLIYWLRKPVGDQL